MKLLLVGGALIFRVGWGRQPLATALAFAAAFTAAGIWRFREYE
jgi:hypothetical protein